MKYNGGGIEEHYKLGRWKQRENKLSKQMQMALDKIEEGWYSAYELQVSLITLRALEDRGLLESRHDSGSAFFPRSCIMWRKTKEESK